MISSFVRGVPTVVMILGTGLLLTVKTGFIQVRRFGTALKCTVISAVSKTVPGRQKGRTGNSGALSQFEAFSTAISGTVGTGNIIGVVAAILYGGPGAVFWMWVSAFFGMATSYAEIVLGMYFRKRDGRGGFSGGPFYSIACGMGKRKLALAEALFFILAAIGMSGVQTNKITSTLTEAVSKMTGVRYDAGGFDPVKLTIGSVAAAVTAVVIFGGIKRIGKVTSVLAPLMSLLFILLALIAIGKNLDRVPGAFGQIFREAFGASAAGGGVLGYGFSAALQQGIARGVFSNEAGLGSSVIAHSAAETREPAEQGFWGIFGVFFDTFIICTLSALMFLTSFDIRTVDPNAMDDSAWSMSMFSASFGSFGAAAFTVILPLFAFTTVVAWSYYGEKATEFFFGKRKYAVIVFRSVYIAVTAVSGLIQGRIIWDIADTFNGLTAAPNLICLAALSGLAVRITGNYFDRMKGADVTPVLFARDKEGHK